MTPNTQTICMMSSLHSLYDDRIYWKEAISFKKAGFNVIHLAAGEQEKDFVSEHGIRMVQVKKYKSTGNLFLNNLSKRFSSRNEYRKLLKVAAELKADVYHLHDLQLNKIARQLKTLPQNPLLVYDVHEPYPITIADGEYKGFLFRKFMKLYARYIHHWELKTSAVHDLIIATEENVAGKFRHHFPGKKVEIIYNYCDTGAADFQDSKDKKYDFIYAGGIRRRRGAMEMLKAVKLLKSEDIPVKLLLVGVICDEGLEDDMTQFLAENNLDDLVTIMPPVPYRQVMDLYNASRCGIAIFNKQLVNQTIMPIKTFEYIAFGLPAVCSNVGHMGHITRQYNTGIAVDPDQVPEIAEAMKKLMTDTLFYNTQRSNCLDLYEKEFNWEKMERHLESIYHTMLSTRTLPISNNSEG